MKLASLVLIMFFPILFFRCIRFAIRCLGKSAINLLSPLVSQVGLKDLKAKQNISLANHRRERANQISHSWSKANACMQPSVREKVAISPSFLEPEAQDF